MADETLTGAGGRDSLNITPDGENGATETHLIEAGSGDAVTLPDGFNFGDAKFEPSGPDLVLTSPDGKQVVIQDYYEQDPAPDLHTPQGGELAGSTAVRLAQVNSPTQGQTAQAAPTADAQPIGQVESVSGTVTAIRANGERVELQVGDPVFQGDVMESGDQGAIGVVLADETTFSMAENGRMVLDEMVYDPGTQEGNISMSVLKGVFTFVSGQVAKVDPDAMVLKTPVAAIGIRGTQVGIDLSGEDPAGMKVVLMEESDGFVGEVVIANNAGIQILNLPDQGASVASSNAAPSQPRVYQRSEISDSFRGALDSLPTEVGTGNDYSANENNQQQDEETEVEQDEQQEQEASDERDEDEFAEGGQEDEGADEGNEDLDDFETASGGEEEGEGEGEGEGDGVVFGSTDDVAAEEAAAAAAAAAQAAAEAESARVQAEIDAENAVADTATVTVNAASGEEDGDPISLSITATMPGGSTDVVQSVTVTGLPDGATLSAGTLNDNGSYTLTPAQLAGLTLDLATDDSADFALGVSATTVDPDQTTSTTTTGTTSLGVTVDATGDVSVTALDVTGVEDGDAVSLDLTVLISDVDNSETLTELVVTFDSLPEGTVITGGTLVGNVLTVAAADIDNVVITPPADYSGTLVGSTVAYTNEGESIADGFTVTVDATGDISLSVGDVNVDEGETIDLGLSADSFTIGDVDNSEVLESIQIEFTELPEGAIVNGATLNDDGSYTVASAAALASVSVTPPDNYEESFGVVLTVTTNEGSESQSFNVNVSSVNDVPVITSSPTFDMNEDGVITITEAQLLVGAEDADGDDLSVNSVTLTDGDGVLTGPVEGVYTFTPSDDWNGEVDLAYNVSDGTANISQTAGITVAPVNDEPDAIDQADSAVEDASFIITPESLLAGSSDIDGDTLSVIDVQTSSSDGTLSGPDGDGNWTFTPNQDFNGEINFTYTVDDASGAENSTDTANFTLTYTPENDDPQLDLNVPGTPPSFNENGDPVKIAASANVVDPDSDDFDGGTLSVAISDSTIDGGDVLSFGSGQIQVDGNDLYITQDGEQVVIGSFVGGEDGSDLVVTFNENATEQTVQNVVKQITFENTTEEPSETPRDIDITLTDGDGGSSSGTVQVEVNEINDDPEAADGLTGEMNEDGSFDGAVSAEDVDHTDAELDFSVEANDGPAHGDLVFNADGTYSYTPDPDYSGSDSFTYTVTDAEGATDTAVVNLTIAPGGDISVTASDIGGTETDAALTVDLQLTAGATDADGSESLLTSDLTLTGLPDGTILQSNVGGVITQITLVDNGNGSHSADVVGVDASTLQVVLPQDWAGDFSGSLHSTTDEGGDATAGFTATIGTEGDVSVSVSDVSASEGDTINLGLDVDSFDITDADGSETVQSIEISFTNLPEGAVVSGATYDENTGTYTVTSAAALSAVSVTPSDAEWSG
ncbi:MAG: tandem-95 repeat protein, partial [Rhodospirillaceae bacterium]|nr:tandem-95 repeat protein [Rhodospirillaceae bacterium]